MLDEVDLAILCYMKRAPQGRYTAAQLARNLGYAVAEVQQHLAQLEAVGAIARRSDTPIPLFGITASGLQAIGAAA